MSESKNEVVVYQPDETTRLDVRVADDTVWLTQAQMTELFQRDRTVITLHINNVFAEGELDEKSNVHFLHIPISGRKRKGKMKVLSILIAISMLCGVAIAEEPASVGNAKGGKAALVESLVGPTSVFLDCGQSDTWESVDALKRQYNLADAEMAAAMADVIGRTVGETNAIRSRIRAGAAMMLGKYGTVENLPLLRSVVLEKGDPADTLAFQSYQALAPMDKVVELVEATYADPDCKSYRRVRGIFFLQNEKRAKDGTIPVSERAQLCEFMKRHVAVEPDVRDVLEIDGLLSLLDMDYAESRERMINIGKPLKSGRPVDSLVMSNVLKRLESAKLSHTCSNYMRR